MTLSRKATGFIAAFTIAAIFMAASQLNRTLHYYRDVVHGWYLQTSNTILPRRATVTVLNPSRQRPYRRTYRQLAGGFHHLGSLLIYRAEERVSLHSIAEGAIRYTDHYLIRALAADIRRTNDLRGDHLAPGDAVVIPGALPALTLDPCNRAMARLITARGLYFSGTSAGSLMILNHIAEWKELGINAVVFDAKDVTGILNYRSRVPDAVTYDTHEHRTIANIEKLIRDLKRQDIYVIARLAVFHDQLLYKRAPNLAIRTRSGALWETGNERWVDPTSRAVQDYNIALAVELAGLGVDEIQFDYIRFPTGGNPRDAVWRYDFGAMKREDTIARFLQRARAAIAARNARLSIDIFGVVAWGKEVDINSTGQRIEKLARHCDVISPMLYPSHFNDDFDGYARPGDAPYYFINEGCKRVMALSGKHAEVRPWLQAFRWRVSRYDKNYIIRQVNGSVDSGARGYLFWNAGNEYSAVLAAMEDLKAANNRAASQPTANKRPDDTAAR